jgi:hypothetical protein
LLGEAEDWQMEETRPAVHDIVAYTDSLEVRGVAKAWPPRRILDVLNSTQTPYLTVEDAAVMPLSRWGKAQPASAPAIILNKAEIVLVWLVRESGVPASELSTVHKVPQNVITYAGPFVARGTMHIIREANLSQALDVTSEQFVALTNPSVLSLSVEGISLEGGLVLCLNRGKVMAIQAVG